LESGEYDVHEVFGQSGFASQSVFYAAFAREKGVSPLRYMAATGHPLTLKKEIEKVLT
jgi:AraC-like DNA-binding protein